MRRLCMGCMEKYNDQLAFCPYCGRPFQCEPEQPYYIAPGTVLHQRYIVGKVLGSGGFGITYIGWDYLLERKVAIKEYFPREYVTRMMNQPQVMVYPGERESWYREGLEKVLEEAKRLAQFEAVSGIVQIYDCFPENGTSYIVMEFLEGMTLKAYLDQKGPMEEKQALQVVLQIAWAMEEVHAAGILHRDISPDNIYVLNPESPEKLKVKLLDFGAARYSATKEQRSLSVIIKPGYAPEEQYYRRGEQGPWTDVYALAATLYKMLTGITPENALERKVKDELQRPSKLGYSLSRSTEAALMNALQMSIRERTQSMEEFAHELTAENVKERKSREYQAAQRWISIAAPGVCLTVLIIAVIWHFNGFAKREQPKMVRVPNVMNMDVNEAQQLLISHGLWISEYDTAFSDEADEGQILYQDKQEGTLVEEGTEIQVTISKGKKGYPLPEVLGLQAEEAKAVLEDAGFTNVTQKASMEEGAYNTVIAVAVNGESLVVSAENEEEANRPEAVISWLEQFYSDDGEEEKLVAEDAHILLTICKKRPEMAVPDVRGMSAEEASEILMDAGFQVNLTTRHSEKAKGTVIGQEPEAGDLAEELSFVTVKVSLGSEMVIMPDLRFMELEKAEEVLEENGLVMLFGTQEVYSDTVAKGLVITQSVEPGIEVPKGQMVVVEVSLGPEPKETETQTSKAETMQAPTRKTSETVGLTEAARSSQDPTVIERTNPGNENSGAKSQTSAAAESETYNPPKKPEMNMIGIPSMSGLQ